MLVEKREARLIAKAKTTLSQAMPADIL